MSKTVLAVEDEMALAMIREAGLTPSVAAVSALGSDLYALTEEMSAGYESPLSVIDLAKRELQSRIGGLQNLDSYIRCLLVPKRK